MTQNIGFLGVHTQPLAPRFKASIKMSLGPSIFTSFLAVIYNHLIIIQPLSNTNYTPVLNSMAVMDVKLSNYSHHVLLTCFQNDEGLFQITLSFSLIDDRSHLCLLCFRIVLS